jgi:hypothetical protein
VGELRAAGGVGAKRDRRGGGEPVDGGGGAVSRERRAMWVRWGGGRWEVGWG